MTQQLTPFRAGTQRQRISLPPKQSTAFGDRQNFVLNPGGWLRRIDLPWNSSLVTGAGTPAGNFNTYPPAPWNQIRQLRFFSNTMAQMISTSGWGMHMHNLTGSIYRQTDPAATAYALRNTNNAQLIRNNQLPAGTPAASTTYPTAQMLRIPVETDDLFQRGLLYLQDQSTVANLEITTGLATDVSSVTGVTVAPTFNFRPAQDLYLVRPDVAPPDTNWVREIVETNFPIAGTGQVTIPVVPGPVYIKILGILENNGAMVAPSVTTPIINSLGYSYGIGNVPVSESYDEHLQNNYMRLNETLYDGMWCWDFSDGFGLPGGIQTDTMNFLDTKSMTNVNLNFNISGITLTNANMRVVFDMLVPRQ